MKRKASIDASSASSKRSALEFKEHLGGISSNELKLACLPFVGWSAGAQLVADYAQMPRLRWNSNELHFGGFYVEFKWRDKLEKMDWELERKIAKTIGFCVRRSEQATYDVLPSPTALFGFLVYDHGSDGQPTEQLKEGLWMSKPTGGISSATVTMRLCRSFVGELATDIAVSAMTRQTFAEQWISWVGGHGHNLRHMWQIWTPDNGGNGDYVSNSFRDQSALGDLGTFWEQRRLHGSQGEGCRLAIDCACSDCQSDCHNQCEDTCAYKRKKGKFERTDHSACRCRFADNSDDE